MTKKSFIPKEIETAFEKRTKAGREHAEAGGVVCGYYGAGMPVEVAMATGHMPMGIMPLPNRDTPRADEWVNDTFEPQSRLILDQLLSDELTFLRVVVAVSKAQPDSRVFQSAREILRQGHGGIIPPLHHYSLLGLQHPVVREFGRREIDGLARRLRANSDVEATPERLRAAIDVTNGIRAQWRELDKARRQRRVSGSDTIKLMSASHFMAPEAYLKAITAAVKAIPSATLEGPRLVIISSTSLNDMLLHDSLEAVGSVVIGEDDFWGSAAVTKDIVPGSDPMQTIYEHYYQHVPNRSVYPASKRLAWFYANAAGPDVDGVVIQMTQSDQTLGWDYPRMRDFLNENGKPHLMTREDASYEKGAAEIAKQAAGFIAKIREKVA